MQNLTLVLTAEEVMLIERALTNVQMENQEKLVTTHFSEEYSLEVLANARKHNDVLRSFYRKARDARRDAK